MSSQARCDSMGLLYLLDSAPSMHTILICHGHTKFRWHNQHSWFVDTTQSVLHRIDIQWLLSVLTHDVSHRITVFVLIQCNICIMYIDQDACSRWPLRVLVTCIDYARGLITIDLLCFECKYRLKRSLIVLLHQEPSSSEACCNSTVPADEFSQVIP